LILPGGLPGSLCGDPRLCLPPAQLLEPERRAALWSARAVFLLACRPEAGCVPRWTLPRQTVYPRRQRPLLP